MYVKFIHFLKEFFLAIDYFIEWVKTKDYKTIFQEMITIFIKEKTV
jgi:hypothetical protein